MQPESTKKGDLLAAQLLVPPLGHLNAKNTPVQLQPLEVFGRAMQTPIVVVTLAWPTSLRNA